MKKQYLLFVVFAVALLAVVSTGKVSSNINFVHQAACNDPVGGGTCISSGCHGGTIVTANQSSVNLKIDTTQFASQTFDANFKYTPGKTYYIGLQVLVPAYVSGFQMTALNNSNGMAGSFTALSQTKLRTYGSIDYISHLNANHNTSSWIFQWTAPATGHGPVTFYYAVNPADSLSFDTLGASNGNIYTGTVTIHELGVGINEISEKLNEWHVYPNPVTRDFSLSFDLKKQDVVKASVYSLDGKISKELLDEKLNPGYFNQNYDISAFPSGIYLVKLSVGQASITEKIIKE